MDNICFTSVAFGERYLAQQERLRESILKIYPQANINFYFDRLPATSRSFFESLYGFKVHAIKETKDMGFDKIIWLDPAMILCDKIDDLFQYNVIAVKDDNLLHDLISEQTLSHYNLTRERIKSQKWHLVGGSIYYFDFDKRDSYNVFTQWYESEKKGLFGSQQQAAMEQIQGHRNDETLMAVAMYSHGLEPQGADKVRYCQEVNPMFIKKHFK